MSKPMLGLVVGGILGLLDGLSAYFSPAAASMMVQIVVGSTVKGLLTGVLAGVFAQRLRSLPLGIVFALVVGLVLSYLAALAPDPQGNHHYLEIMLPGGILGALVGFATQRYGVPKPTTVSRASAVLLLSLLAAPLFAASNASPEDPWAAIRFLEGEWKGDSEGEPGKGSVKRTYRFVLAKKFLHEQNISTYPAQPKNPKGEVHEHWSFFSFDRSRRTLVFRQLHQEGFVIQYSFVGGGNPEKIVFESESLENTPGGWKARETYDRVSADEFVETFELAAGTGPYEVYSKTRFQRAKAVSSGKEQPVGGLAARAPLHRREER